jgi:hypothetical protein
MDAAVITADFQPSLRLRLQILLTGRAHVRVEMVGGTATGAALIAGAAPKALAPPRSLSISGLDTASQLSG